MKDIDYEGLFIYMSLIFAFCIFITILYGCAFSSNYPGNSQVFENFLSDDDKGDVKTQVLSLLKDLETKDTTSDENKTEIKDTIEKINNNNISITELKKTINLLKGMAAAGAASSSGSSGDKKNDTNNSDTKTDNNSNNTDSTDNKDNKDNKDSKDSKDSKDKKD
jgi:hypothetical protein